MKIAHVVEAFGGGTLNAVVLLANHQVEAGHQVMVIHSFREDTPANYAQLFDVRVHLVGLAIPQGLNPLLNAKAAGRLRLLLNADLPDLVHLHSSKAGAVGRLALLGTGVPTVYSPHGFAFVRQDIAPWKRRVFWEMERVLGKLGSRLMACSTDEANAARSFAPTELIFNAVDPDGLRATASEGRSQIKRGPAQPPLVVAMAGRITAARNPGQFSEVARRIRAMRKNVVFYWLGEGERQLLDSSIPVTGWLSKPDLLASLRGADVYFHPSAWDGLPFAVLEAMSQGLPVVASSAGGNKDAVVPGETGSLADTVDAQVRALLQLLDDPQLRARQGKAGLDRVQSCFSLKHYFHQVDALYLTLLKERT